MYNFTDGSFYSTSLSVIIIADPRSWFLVTPGSETEVRMRLSSGVLVAALVTVTTAQRPGPEFNLFSQLDSLRSNLLSLLGSTLTGQPQPRPPPSRPASFSQPPPRPPPRRPAPFPRPPPPQFSGSPNLNQLPPSQPRPIQNPSQNPVQNPIQLQNPGQNPRPVVSVQPVLRPAPASPGPSSTFPIVEVVPNNFDNTLVSEQLVLAPAPGTDRE